MRCGREGEGFGRSPLDQIPYLHGHGVLRQDPRCRPVLGLDVLGRTQPRPGLAPSTRHADPEWLWSRGGVEARDLAVGWCKKATCCKRRPSPTHSMKSRLPNPSLARSDASVLRGLAAEPRARSRHRFLARLGVQFVWVLQPLHAAHRSGAHSREQTRLELSRPTDACPVQGTVDVCARFARRARGAGT